VSKPTYINCEAKTILGRLQGHYDYGDGRTKEDPNYMIFSSRNCNYPQPKYAKWFLSQYRRWGLVKGAPDYEGVASSHALGHLRGSHEGDRLHPRRPGQQQGNLFDGATFDPAGDLEAYAKVSPSTA